MAVFQLPTIAQAKLLSAASPAQIDRFVANNPGSLEAMLERRAEDVASWARRVMAFAPDQPPPSPAFMRGLVVDMAVRDAFDQRGIEGTAPQLKRIVERGEAADRAIQQVATQERQLGTDDATPDLDEAGPVHGTLPHPYELFLGNRFTIGGCR